MRALTADAPSLAVLRWMAVVAALLLAPPLDRASADVELTTPDLMVVGVVIPDHGIALAAIEHRESRRTRFYRIGDSVNGGVVTAIGPDRVTIVFESEAMLFRLAGAAAPVGSHADRLRDSRRSAHGIVSAVRGSNGFSSPYGRLGAITPSFLRVSRKGEDDRGGVTGGGGGGGGGSTTAGVGVGANTTAIQFIGVLHGGSEQPGEQFSGPSLRDLLISITHTNLSATKQRIELLTPDGGLYQGYAGDATPASQIRVPIGGTWITEHGLFGTWTVRIYLDREPTPAATGAFILSP